MQITYFVALATLPTTTTVRVRNCFRPSVLRRPPLLLIVRLRLLLTAPSSSSRRRRTYEEAALFRRRAEIRKTMQKLPLQYNNNSLNSSAWLASVPGVVNSITEPASRLIPVYYIMRRMCFRTVRSVSLLHSKPLHTLPAVVAIKLIAATATPYSNGYASPARTHAHMPPLRKCMTEGGQARCNNGLPRKQVSGIRGLLHACLRDWCIYVRRKRDDMRWQLGDIDG